MSRRTQRRQRAAQSRGNKMALRTARMRQNHGPMPTVSPCEKFIPNADREFAVMAHEFAHAVASNPILYNVSDEDATMLARRVKEFRAALILVERSVRTPRAVRDKAAARKVAEEWVRGLANQIRGDSGVEQRHKDSLGLLQRPKRLSKRLCPVSPPVVTFLCALDADDAFPARHVLEFREINTKGSARKPGGAASLHLYFDFVPAGEPIPRHPAQHGWPKFLQECSRSPAKVEFPMPLSGPMTIVYWGRWSDGKGQTGAWSEPCVGPYVGARDFVALPEGAAARSQRMVFIQPPRQLIGEVKRDDGDKEAEALMTSLSQHVLEAATTRLLNAA